MRRVASGLRSCAGLSASAEIEVRASGHLDPGAQPDPADGDRVRLIGESSGERCQFPYSATTPATSTPVIDRSSEEPLHCG